MHTGRRWAAQRPAAQRRTAHLGGEHDAGRGVQALGELDRLDGRPALEQLLPPLGERLELLAQRLLTLLLLLRSAPGAGARSLLFLCRRPQTLGIPHSPSSSPPALSAGGDRGRAAGDLAAEICEASAAPCAAHAPSRVYSSCACPGVGRPWLTQLGGGCQERGRGLGRQAAAGLALGRQVAAGLALAEARPMAEAHLRDRGRRTQAESLPHTHIHPATHPPSLTHR